MLAFSTEFWALQIVIVQICIVREFLVLPHQYGICDHQDASSGGQRDETLLGAKTPRSPTDCSLAVAIWECHKHSPYSPNLAPSDYHLFSPLKKHLGGNRFQNVVEVQEAVSQWQTPELYAEGIH
jgi:hypothetical protein